MKYLLDSDTLIYAFKRAGNCLTRMSLQADGDLAVSCINLFELEYGMAKSVNSTLMARYLREICLRYTVLDFDQAAARQAGQVRAHLQTLGTPIGPYDLQVAGVALSQNLTLVSRNTREFQRVPGLRLENWFD
ncbi:type II toxin-antitoxin system VapC family toxin [Rhodoferax sp.]|uniref:type II toxin-antitoxin system VapC family toxin n=1 Tax=Rhodoferax sp. TaxID=50421 RepID=UPI0026348911|nr:type II toxin-antitoxin system VapC family toxin [Rhodoferax sp.]MDD4944293.1 type II toxin-antitoxin system VapC family toxin [Rhodoferax sp.]MDD5478231.1 type II toxin-antitoxin system VapC family toxin [Rhodoferax sp.]